MIGHDVATRAAEVYARGDYVFMETWGSNDGPKVREWSARYGMRKVAWCGIGISGCAAEVPGAWAVYGGNGFFSPAVAQIEANGRRLGWRWDGTGRIPPGAVVTYGGDDHTNFVLLDHGPIGGLATTVGFNESDGAKVSERSLVGARVWIPPGLRVPPVPTPEYDFGLEDPRADGKQFVLSSFMTAAARDKRLAIYMRPGSPYRQYHPRPHRRKRGGRTEYLIIGGPVHWYGPYDTRAQREDARRLLVPRLRRFWKLPPEAVVLRPFRVPEPEYLAALREREEWVKRFG